MCALRIAMATQLPERRAQVCEGQEAGATAAASSLRRSHSASRSSRSARSRRAISRTVAARFRAPAVRNGKIRARRLPPARRDAAHSAGAAAPAFRLVGRNSSHCGARWPAKRTAEAWPTNAACRPQLRLGAARRSTSPNQFATTVTGRSADNRSCCTIRNRCPSGATS